MIKLTIMDLMETKANSFEIWLQTKRGEILSELENKFPGFLGVITEGVETVTQNYSLDTPKEYHNAVHTFMCLQNAIDMYAVSHMEPGLEHEAIDIRELALLLSAIAFHDSIINPMSELGFGYSEDQSANLAVKRLQESRIFDTEEINMVSELIKATKTMVTKEGIERFPIECDDERFKLMVSYIRDVDVANLGNNEFFETTKHLAMEWGLTGKEFPGFIKNQVQILTQFRYNTATAKRLFRERNKNKEILEKYCVENSEIITFDHFLEHFDL